MEEAQEPPASPEAAPDEESASRTFFTGIDAEAKKSKGGKDKNRFRNLESTDSGGKIIQHFSELTNLANSLHLRMDALLKEHEQDGSFHFQPYVVRTSSWPTRRTCTRPEAFGGSRRVGLFRGSEGD